MTQVQATCARVGERWTARQGLALVLVLGQSDWRDLGDCWKIVPLRMGMAYPTAATVASLKLGSSFLKISLGLGSALKPLETLISPTEESVVGWALPTSPRKRRHQVSFCPIEGNAFRQPLGSAFLDISLSLVGIIPWPVQPTW
jgi:hypothetical protein